MQLKQAGVKPVKYNTLERHTTKDQATPGSSSLKRDSEMAV